MKYRKILAGVLLLFIFGTIAFVFWQQELKYVLPTPVPEGYQIVPVNQTIAHLDSAVSPNTKPKFYHFFKPNCPCSRFNVRHFNQLYETYRSKVDFLLVVPPGSDYEKSLSYFKSGLSVTVDDGLQLASAFGVYATPQAVIVNTDRSLYFRGNYNKARYCTDPGSNFAQMALDSLLAGSRPPEFGLLATVSYGCGLPSDDNNLWSFTF